MKRRRITIAVIVLVLALLGLAVAFDPAARVEGWLKGEPFYDGRSASAWRRDLAQPKANDRIRAMEDLAGGKGEAVAVLSLVLRSADVPEARWRAADALGRIGEPARPAGPDLIRALDDPDPHVGAIAARSLGELGPEVPGSLAALIAAFPRVEAVRAVSAFGPAAAEAVPALTALLIHADSVVRWNAARALGKLKAASADAVPILAAALTDPAAEVREHAAEALGLIGPAAAAAVPDLIQALADPVPRVRRDAVRSLGQLGANAKPALAAVQARKTDDDPDVRQMAEQAERRIDPTLAGKKD